MDIYISTHWQWEHLRLKAEDHSPVLEMTIVNYGKPQAYVDLNTYHAQELLEALKEFLGQS